MRSTPGEGLVGKRDADVDEDRRAAAAQPEHVAAELADAAERDDLEIAHASATAPGEREEVLERELLGADARVEAERRERLLPPRARRDPRQGVGERLAPHAESQRLASRSAASRSAGIERVRPRLERDDARTSPSAAGETRRAAGRRGCARPPARRCAPRGIRTRRRRARATSRRATSFCTVTTQRRIAGSSIAAWTIGVAALYGRFATSTACPATPPSASHSRSGRESASPCSTATRPPSSSAREGACAQRVDLDRDDARRALRERAGQRAVAGTDLEDGVVRRRAARRRRCAPRSRAGRGNAGPTCDEPEGRRTRAGRVLHAVTAWSRTAANTSARLSDGRLLKPGRSRCRSTLSKTAASKTSSKGTRRTTPTPARSRSTVSCARFSRRRTSSFPRRPARSCSTTR